MFFKKCFVDYEYEDKGDIVNFVMIFIIIDFFINIIIYLNNLNENIWEFKLFISFCFFIFWRGLGFFFL